MEITKGSIKIQIHSVRLTLYNLKSNESRTQNSNFLLCNEPGAVSTYVANRNNERDAHYLAVLGYIKSRNANSLLRPSLQCDELLCRKPLHCPRAVATWYGTSFTQSLNSKKGKDKGHPCTVTEALYRPYGL